MFGSKYNMWNVGYSRGKEYTIHACLVEYYFRRDGHKGRYIWQYINMLGKDCCGIIVSYLCIYDVSIISKLALDARYMSSYARTIYAQFCRGMYNGRSIDKIFYERRPILYTVLDGKLYRLDNMTTSNKRKGIVLYKIDQEKIKITIVSILNKY